MWLFLTKGFVSVVEHRDDPTKVLVRARVLDDLSGILARYVERPCEIISHEGTDYPFRSILTKTELRALLDRSVEDLSYDNFKTAACTDDRRSEIYHSVWQELRGLEELN